MDIYINRDIIDRKKQDKHFAEGFDVGYEQFKVGVMLKNARKAAGVTQEELARKLKTRKSALSRIENHAQDIKLSTLKKFAAALGKKLRISFR